MMAVRDPGARQERHQSRGHGRCGCGRCGRGLSRLVAGGLRRPRVRERGSVTAELAIGLPWLVLVVVVALWGVGAMGAKIACVDAARAGVRAASRGEPLPAVRAAVARAAPRNAQVSVRRGGGTASVVVTAAVRPPIAGGLPALTIRESAEGVTETGVADAPAGGGHAGDG